jgi:hypothetical protein
MITINLRLQTNVHEVEEKQKNHASTSQCPDSGIKPNPRSVMLSTRRGILKIKYLLGMNIDLQHCWKK